MPDFLTNFHFIRPAWLLAALPALVLWWFWQKRSDPLRGWREQMEPALLEALVVGKDAHSSSPARLLLAAWLLAIIAVAGPTWKLEPSPFADDATPLLILLKADVTMDIPDPAPSRLERARLKIADLADARKGQPLGLIAYAGSAHLVMPPTRDTPVIAQMAGEISPSIMPEPGDRLDLALMEAERVLKRGKQGGGILVLAEAVDTDPALIAAARKKLSFPVQFLAINSPDSSQDNALRSAARSLDGKVVPISAGDDDIASIVRRASRTPVAAKGGKGELWQEAGYWMVPAIALIVLLSFRRVEEGEVPA